MSCSNKSALFSRYFSISDKPLLRKRYEKPIPCLINCNRNVDFQTHQPALSFHSSWYGMGRRLLSGVYNVNDIVLSTKDDKATLSNISLRVIERKKPNQAEGNNSTQLKHTVNQGVTFTETRSRLTPVAPNTLEKGCSWPLKANQLFFISNYFLNFKWKVQKIQQRGLDSMTFDWEILRYFV